MWRLAGKKKYGANSHGEKIKSAGEAGLQRGLMEESFSRDSIIKRDRPPNKPRPEKTVVAAA